MKYLFDTTTYSHLLKGNQNVADILRGAETILFPNIVIAELKYGFMLGSRREENEQLLNRFIANKKIRVTLPDNATTDYFASIAVFAHKKGVQLSTHDLWIAALTEQWDVTLVTFDKDFKHLGYEGIKLHLEN
ncbi:MAG TPA: PIN domain-containing protein [Candidatus Saccharimonadales bacterium]|nr:PIN domain-containing protein [Candidatus Saccharimonadales bacterium]